MLEQPRVVWLALRVTEEEGQLSTIWLIAFKGTKGMEAELVRERERGVDM